MIVAEDGETSSLPEFGHLPQCVIIYVPGDDDSWRVRGTHGEVSVHGAQSPPIMLQTEEKGDEDYLQLLRKEYTFIVYFVVHYLPCSFS